MAKWREFDDKHYRKMVILHEYRHSNRLAKVKYWPMKREFTVDCYTGDNEVYTRMFTRTYESEQTAEAFADIWVLTGEE